MKSKFLFLPDKEPIPKLSDNRIKVSPHSLLAKLKGYSVESEDFMNNCIKKKENLVSILEKYKAHCPLLKDNAIYFPCQEPFDSRNPARPVEQKELSTLPKQAKEQPLLSDMTFIKLIDTSGEINEEGTVWAKAFWRAEKKMVFIRLSEIKVEEFISWDQDENEEKDLIFFQTLKTLNLSEMFADLIANYEFLRESKDRFLSYEHLNVSIFEHDSGVSLQDLIDNNVEFTDSEVLDIIIPLVESLIEIQDKGLSIESTHLQPNRLVLRKGQNNNQSFTPDGDGKAPPPSAHKDCPFIFTDLSIIKRDSTTYIMKRSTTVIQAVIKLIFKMKNCDFNSAKKIEESKLLLQMRNFYSQSNMDLISLLDQLLVFADTFEPLESFDISKIDIKQINKNNIEIDEMSLYGVYIRLGCYKDAYASASKALGISEKKNGPHSLKTIKIKIDQAYLKSLVEKASIDALAILSEAFQELDYVKKKEDDYSSVKAACLKYMACIHADIKGDHKKACHLLEKAGRISKLNVIARNELELLKADIQLKFTERLGTPICLEKVLDSLDPLACNSKKACYLMTECLNLMIREFTSAENFRAVVENSEKLIKLKEEIFGPLYCDIPMLLNNLGLLYQNYFQDLDTAEILLNNCIQSLIILYGQLHPYLGPCLNNLAAIFSERGHHFKALDLIEMSWELTKLAKAEAGKPEKIMYLSNMAMLYQKTGNYAKALNLGEQALAMARQESRDKNNEAVASLLNLLGGIYREMGEKNKALKMCEEGLEIRRLLSGSNFSCDLATSINDLALIYKDLNMNQKSLEYFESSYEIFKKVFGEVHPHVATALNNLAVLHLQMKNRERSLQCFQEALNILRQIYQHEEHPSVASLLHNFALLNFQLGKYNEARGFFQESMAMTDKINGRDNIDYLQSAVCLADLLHDIRQYAEADAIYAEALQRASSLYQKRHQFVLSIKSKLLKNKRHVKGSDVKSCCAVF